MFPFLSLLLSHSSRTVSLLLGFIICKTITHYKNELSPGSISSERIPSGQPTQEMNSRPKYSLFREYKILQEFNSRFTHFKGNNTEVWRVCLLYFQVSFDLPPNYFCLLDFVSDGSCCSK